MPPAAIPELLLDDAVFLVSLQCIQDSIEHQFRRPALLREALVGERVPVRIGGEIVQQGNQKIALVGDAALKMAYMDSMMSKEHRLCNSIQRDFDVLGSNAFLEKKGREWYVDHMIVNASDEVLPYPDRTDVASAMEGIIGAVWLDSGKDLEAVKKVIRNLLGEDYFD